MRHVKIASVIAAASLLLSVPSGAAEIRVMAAGAVREAYVELVAQFEKATGHKVVSDYTNVLIRLNAGEPCDLVILAGPFVDDQIKAGRAVAGSRLDFASIGVGVAVRKGAAKPDIGSPDALKKALLAAKSIGYSSGPSGRNTLIVFEQLGIADEVKGKLKQSAPSSPVGGLIVSGEAELGFQQITELLHHDGIDYVGPLPAELQQKTMFSTGIHAAAMQADAARALARFLTAPAAATAIRKHGMEPG
jgi:molybdate transport system substrate-binding protein